MPVDSRFRCGIGQNVEGSACDIRLGHACPDAQRFYITALLVRPLVQIFASLLQHVLGAVLVKFLNYDVPVAAPLIDKAVLVILDLS